MDDYILRAEELIVVSGCKCGIATKTCISVFLAIVLMVLLHVNFFADADAISIELPRNTFLERNSCEQMNRHFYVNSKDGFIRPRTEPGESGIESNSAEHENGTILFISHTYDRDGDLWGMIDYSPFSMITYVWVAMDQLALVYDYISFADDHKDELYSFRGNMKEVLNAEKIVLWTWPGSGVYAKDFFKSKRYIESHMVARVRSFAQSHSYWHFLQAYSDSQGREWVFIEYGDFGNAWLCVSDPSNGDIPAFNPAPTPKLRQPGGASFVEIAGVPVPTIAIILVVAVVAVTGVLIRVFWKKKPKTVDDS